MKYSLSFFLFLIILGGCGGNGSQTGNVQERTPRTAVTIVAPVLGKIDCETVLPAVTAYQNKASVSPSVPSFVDKALVTPGSRVTAGEEIFIMQSRESRALGTDTRIPVKAAMNGIVLDVRQQMGDYVADGAVLCTMAELSSLVFEINVPAEQAVAISKKSSCVIELPDGMRLRARVLSSLVQMNTESQSVKLIAKATALLKETGIGEGQTSSKEKLQGIPFLPEGLNVKAIFTDNRKEEALVLPRATVQSDEALTEHWVMKLDSDSTAVRVSVRIGNSSETSVEVASENLSVNDRIVLTGGYGLADGALVEIVE